MEFCGENGGIPLVKEEDKSRPLVLNHNYLFRDLLQSITYDATLECLQHDTSDTVLRLVPASHLPYAMIDVSCEALQGGAKWSLFPIMSGGWSLCFVVSLCAASATRNKSKGMKQVEITYI